MTDQAAPQPPSAQLPDDAGDTRAYHFKRLMGHPVTLILGAIAVLGAGIAGAALIGPAIGAAAVAVVVLVIVGIVYAIASSQAEQDFFRAYAAGRGLTWTSGHQPVPPATPLLQKGDDRYSEETLVGTLPGGLSGALCLYTYEEESRDSQGNTETTYYHFTVAMCDVPDTAPFVRELFCQRRSGLRILDSAEDVFRQRQRVELESDAFDKRYEVFAGENDDMNRVRQVFEPSFIVWLTESTPKEFAFELAAGTLVVNVEGHKKTAMELDTLCQAAGQVSKRLRAEAGETPAA